MALPRPIGAWVPVLGSRFHCGGKPSSTPRSANTFQRPARMASAAASKAADAVGGGASKAIPDGAATGAGGRIHSPTPSLQAFFWTIWAMRQAISGAPISLMRLIFHAREVIPAALPGDDK